MVNIVTEGCDCVGKTTFASLLAEKTGYTVVKGSSFEISEFGSDGMFEHMMGLLDRENVIIDRFFYSNLVYGFLYNYPMMNQFQYAELSKKLSKKTLVIYLNAPQNIIAERMAMRGDDMIKLEDIGNILTQYEKAMNGIYMPRMMFSLDTSNSDFSIVSAMIKEILEQDLVKTYLNS
jgi:thymidylate kinase